MKKVPELRDDDLPAREAWPHPADGLDGAAEPGGEAEALLAGKQIAGDLFRRLMSDCIPSRAHYGGGRRWKAGYVRMVATVYEVAPEMFDGLTSREVAATLGISWWAFRKQRRAVRDMMAARQAPRR